MMSSEQHRLFPEINLQEDRSQQTGGVCRVDTHQLLHCGSCIFGAWLDLPRSASVTAEMNTGQETQLIPGLPLFTLQSAGSRPKQALREGTDLIYESSEQAGSALVEVVPTLRSCYKPEHCGSRREREPPTERAWWTGSEGGRKRRDARTPEEERHRGGHFITPCDLNSNQLRAKAARRCKRRRKKEKMAARAPRDTLTHFDSTINSVWLIGHITSRQQTQTHTHNTPQSRSTTTAPPPITHH